MFWHGTVRIKKSCDQSFIEPYRGRASLVVKQGCMAWNDTAQFFKCCLNIPCPDYWPRVIGAKRKCSNLSISGAMILCKLNLKDVEETVMFTER